MKLKENHSKKVQQIMNQKPHFIIRWGNLIVLLLVVLLGIILWIKFEGEFLF